VHEIAEGEGRFLQRSESDIAAIWGSDIRLEGTWIRGCVIEDERRVKHLAALLGHLCTGEWAPFATSVRFVSLFAKDLRRTAPGAWLG